MLPASLIRFLICRGERRARAGEGSWETCGTRAMVLVALTALLSLLPLVSMLQDTGKDITGKSGRVGAKELFSGS